MQRGDLPVADPAASGGYRLPPPVPTATIYSWGAVTCVTGGCGDVVDPSLTLAYRHVMDKERVRANSPWWSADLQGQNDGVVSIWSSRFGIHMGVLPKDHFDWNRAEQSFLSGAVSWLFGVEREPPETFFYYWFDELARAGY